VKRLRFILVTLCFLVLCNSCGFDDREPTAPVDQTPSGLTTLYGGVWFASTAVIDGIPREFNWCWEFLSDHTGMLYHFEWSEDFDLVLESQRAITWSADDGMLVMVYPESGDDVHYYYEIEEQGDRDIMTARQAGNPGFVWTADFFRRAELP